MSSSRVAPAATMVGRRTAAGANMATCMDYSISLFQLLSYYKLALSTITKEGSVARKPKTPVQRKVSVWLAVKKPSVKKMEGVDILKDLCGVRHYDLDSQELSAVAQDFPKAAVEEILGKLSYSSTFIDAACRAAAEQSIKHAYWALAQYDFVYTPKRGRKVDDRAPLFLGVFDWNDSADDEQFAAWARGEE